MFKVGSVKNASEFITNSKFINNYIQKEYHEGYDIAQALRDGKHTDLMTFKPAMQTSKAAAGSPLAAQETKQFEKEFEIQYKNWTARKDAYRMNRPKAAALLWGQCSDGMKSKMKARKDFLKIENDPVLLLDAIKDHSMNYEATEYVHKTVTEAVKAFVNLRQSAAVMNM